MTSLKAMAKFASKEMGFDYRSLALDKTDDQIITLMKKKATENAEAEQHSEDQQIKVTVMEMDTVSADTEQLEPPPLMTLNQRTKHSISHGDGGGEQRLIKQEPDNTVHHKVKSSLQGEQVPGAAVTELRDGALVDRRDAAVQKRLRHKKVRQSHPTSRKQMEQRLEVYALHVSNIPPGFMQSDMLRMFSAFGNVRQVSKHVQKSNFCYGFIHFDNAHSAAEAFVAIDGTRLGQHVLRMNTTKNRGANTIKDLVYLIRSDEQRAQQCRRTHNQNQPFAARTIPPRNYITKTKKKNVETRQRNEDVEQWKNDSNRKHLRMSFQRTKQAETETWLQSSSL